LLSPGSGKGLPAASGGRRRGRGGTTIEFELETTLQEPWAIVVLGGELDAHTAPRLREQLSSLLDEGRYQIIVDAERIEFMDSTGLGVLVGARKRATEHEGTLAIVCTRPNIVRLLDITGLDKVFPVFPSLDQALAT
jgi:anti-sigma B factor antagonist